MVIILLAWLISGQKFKAFQVARRGKNKSLNNKSFNKYNNLLFQMRQIMSSSDTTVQKAPKGNIIAIMYTKDNNIEVS
jgi:hypothetical protein